MSRLRLIIAVAFARLAGWLSHALLGKSGETISGRVLLILCPSAISKLAKNRKVILVSATNGKTSTTRALAGFMVSAGTVTTSKTGSNLSRGVASALFTLADLCRIHLERLIGAVQEDTAQKWKWQNRQMLNLAKKLSEEDVSNLKYLYRDIHSREYPELYLVPKDFMEKYEANPSDPILSFSVTLYETLLFKTEFLQWVNLGQNSIFSDDMKRLFKIKEDARQEKLAMDFVRWNLEQDDSE